MKVLYYTWNEITYETCRNAMLEKGWKVDCVDYQFKSYDYDEQFMDNLREQLREGYDFLFSFDYFPIISTVAQENSVLYVSWIYDSPHHTLESKTLGNEFNRVFLFDLDMCTRYRKRGFTNLFYMPMAYNHNHIAKLFEGKQLSYKHDVTFAGAVHDNKKSNLNKIQNMPPELKGYIRGIEEAQLLIYGYDMIDELFSDEKCDELAKYASVDFGPLYYDCRNTIFRNFIREDISAIGRKRAIEAIAGRFSLSLYSGKCPEDIPVKYMGYANATTELPIIFRESKININISARSILSGLPLRIIEVMGAGGFMISNYQAEMQEYFVNDKDIVWFDSQEEMLDKIGFYLENDSDREAIRQRGEQRVRQLFTYDRLLDELLNYAFGL